MAEGATHTAAPGPATATMREVPFLRTIAAAADDDDLDLDPSLAACVQHSLRGPHLSAVAPDTEPPPPTVSAYPMQLHAYPMQLHAATTVDGRDRKRLERVCRYLLRPPFAHDASRAVPSPALGSPTRS